jgi:hypothetical protein
VADERSVDMDERRDDESPPGSGRPVAVSSDLPGPQQAWGRFVQHSRGCVACRDIDQHCGEADRLWKAWQDRARRALDELGG